jgi:hypothetical protein
MTIQGKLEIHCAKIISDIIRPVEQIVVAQQVFFGCGAFLKKHLPYDFVSSSFNSFLLHTVGNENILFNCIKGEIYAKKQDSCITMVAEPSGSGKTHSVYSLGKKGFVFHCRVSNHGEELTLPWTECVERIESISTLKDSGEDNFRCAKSAQLMVQLLIIAYYEIALRVLQIGFRETHDFSSALRFSYTRELLLRFFSHDQAAVIVADFYKS